MNEPIKIKTGREIYQIKENELLNIEYPLIWVIETLQNRLDTGTASKSVVFVMNPSDKEITMPKGITLAYLEESPFKAKRPKRSISSKEANRKIKTGKVKVKNQVNEIKEENVKAGTVPIIPENSALMTERSRNLDRSFRNIYIIPSFPTREQHAHSVQNARSRFTKLNQSYSC